MRALDSNVLIAAVMEGSPHHEIAREMVEQVASLPEPWAIPWPCVYEFLRVSTHSRVFHPPLSSGEAMSAFFGLAESPSLVLLGETERHAAIMKDVIRQSGASGNLVHDAHIAALCIEHGVSELITGDRDFHRFRALNVTNPF
jgi:uncharacterized protein